MEWRGRPIFCSRQHVVRIEAAHYSEGSTERGLGCVSVVDPLHLSSVATGQWVITISKHGLAVERWQWALQGCFC